MKKPRIGDSFLSLTISDAEEFDITWIPEGVGMHVGPVLVSPDRRYVRFGINMNFSSIKGFSTFNMGSGETIWHPRGE